MIAVEAAGQFVGLETTGKPNKQVINHYRLTAHSLDGECATVPCLKPKFAITAARIARHIEKQARQLITDMQHAARANRQQNRKTLDGGIADI